MGPSESTTVGETTNPSCPNGWLLKEHGCYKLIIDEKVTQKRATEMCSSMASGAILAEPMSMDAAQEVRQLVEESQTQDMFWVGMKARQDQEGWVYETEERIVVVELVEQLLAENEQGGQGVQEEQKGPEGIQQGVQGSGDEQDQPAAGNQQEEVVVEIVEQLLAEHEQGGHGKQDEQQGPEQGGQGTEDEQPAAAGNPQEEVQRVKREVGHCMMVSTTGYTSAQCDDKLKPICQISNGKTNGILYITYMTENARNYIF